MKYSAHQSTVLINERSDKLYTSNFNFYIQKIYFTVTAALGKTEFDIYFIRHLSPTT